MSKQQIIGWWVIIFFLIIGNCILAAKYLV
jgi:hypothetical protein